MVPCFRVKVVPVMLKGFIGSLKLALTSWLTGTALARFTGTVEVTVGAIASAFAPVVKIQAKLLASALPARSFAPLAPPAIVAVSFTAEPDVARVLRACGVLTGFGAGFLALAWWCLKLDADG